MTFDVTDSDLSSTVEPADGTGDTFITLFFGYCNSPLTLGLFFPPPLNSSPTLSSGRHPADRDNVQELAESLQQISEQLNTVLGALGSLTQRQSSSPYTAFLPPPLSQPHSIPAPSSTSTPASVLTQMHSLGPSSAAQLSEPPWAWAPQGAPQGAPPATSLFSAPISSGLRASEELLNKRWSQIFPGTKTEELFPQEGLMK